MKVYVIEQGYYSGRGVVGVVETEEEAKKLCETLYTDIDSVGYTEFDTEQLQTKLLRYVVHYSSGEWEADFDDEDLYERHTENTIINEDFYIILAKTADQAIKIAQDMRAEELAKRKGIV